MLNPTFPMQHGATKYGTPLSTAWRIAASDAWPHAWRAMARSNGREKAPMSGWGMGLRGRKKGREG